MPEKPVIYSPIYLSGQQDLNLRPPAPKAGALAGLRYAPNANFKLIIYIIQNGNQSIFWYTN